MGLNFISKTLLQKGNENFDGSDGQIRKISSRCERELGRELECVIYHTSLKYQWMGKRRTEQFYLLLIYSYSKISGLYILRENYLK